MSHDQILWRNYSKKKKFDSPNPRSACKLSPNKLKSKKIKTLDQILLTLWVKVKKIKIQNLFPPIFLSSQS